jgi:hypothetical protein
MPAIAGSNILPEIPVPEKVPPNGVAESVILIAETHNGELTGDIEITGSGVTSISIVPVAIHPFSL